MPQTLRAVIVDDETLARERLHSLLELEDDVEVVAGASGGAEAIEIIEREEPDVVFLDIEMPHVDGFDVAARLHPRETPLIVFVTAYDAFAVRAFEASAVDYLLKPVDSTRLRQALEKVHRRLGAAGSRPERGQLDVLIESVNRRGHPRDRVAVRTGNNYTIVRLEDVIWIEADGNYVVLHTDQSAYRHRALMSELAEVLDGREFIRIHRSTIVNVRKVTLIESWGLGEFLFTLANGKKLPSSRRYKKPIRDVFGL